MIPGCRESPDLSARALDVAPLLLGARLGVTGPAGRVVLEVTEVEAYEGAQDPASHAFRGPTTRTAPMFAAGGGIYVYRSYGIHLCVNVVCGVAGVASAVLVRSGRVVEGGDLARARRPTARRDRDLARGPGNVGTALEVMLEDSGARVGDGRWSLDPGPAGWGVGPARVARGPRVGVRDRVGSGQWEWRFWVAGDPTVSVYRPGGDRRTPRR